MNQELNLTTVVDSIQQINFSTILNQLIIPYGTKILITILIFVIGRYVAKLVSQILSKATLRTSQDPMLQSFVKSISYFLLLLIVIITALSQLGINTSSLVALIGAAGLAIGLSLQNSLQNFAAGVIILVFKPFRYGDFIEAAGVAGTVTKIGILTLELRTADNKTILVPNGKVFGDNITNFSSNETRRVDMIFDIAYDADIEQAKTIIMRCLEEDERVLKDPMPQVAVGALASSSVQLFVRPWRLTSEVLAVRFALTEKVKLEFDKAGITIPFNQMEVHITNNKA